MLVARRIAVVFSVSAVRNNKDLDIFKQATIRPETIPLIAVDLVEGLTNINTTTFQLDMNHRQTVD